MDALLQDVRYTLRSFRATLRLSVAAVLCVALGVGGAVFILTIARGVLLQAPPFPDADRLVRIRTVRAASGERGDVSYPEMRDVAERARSFEAIELAARTRAAFTTTAGTERVRGESVTPGYFDAVAVRPAVGRLFTPDEYRPDAPRVMLIGHALWMRTFGGRPDVVGQAVTVRGNAGMHDERDQLFTVVGVLPPEFAGTVDPDVSEFWLPVEQYTPRPLLDRRRTRSTWALARLRPGVTVAAAHAEVAAVGRQLAAVYPNDYREISLAVEPFGETWRSRFRTGLTMLTAAAGLLLLVACVNIAYLLLARLAHREPELRLRAALGAGRGAIVRQLLVESLLLTLAGGALGTLLAVWGVSLFAAARVFQLPAYVPLAVDGPVVAVALLIVLLTALLSGALPASLGARVDAASHLRGIGPTATLGRRQRRTTDALVAAEVAFSFVLLVGTVLMLRTYENLVRSDVGYRTDRLQRLAVSLDPQAFPTAERQLAFAAEARTALRAQPGVTGVSIVAGVLPPWFDPEVALLVGGAPVPELSAVARHVVDDEFFSVMEIPVREGRAFQASDAAAGSARVAVVSRSVARALVGGDGSAAVGRTVQIPSASGGAPSAAGAARAAVQIVGVAEDVRYHGPRAARRADHDLYLPLAQAPSSVLSVAVATDRDPTFLLAGLQRTLSRLAPTSPLHWISTMDEELAGQYRDARLYAWLTGVFGGSALLLVTIGIYGVMSSAVSRRLLELGVRMAVGARPRDIVLLVLRQASWPMLAGVAVGAAAALGGARLVATLVYGVTPTEPEVYAGVGLGIVVAGLLACWLPARRAVQLDARRLMQGG